MKPFLSVIIPAYNESENIARGTLQTVCDYLDSKNIYGEIIVVNDGSSDIL